MRIVYIAAGAGDSYCGACMLDAAAARTLTALGHETLVIPLYTPLRTDRDFPHLKRVFYGGINAYLEQRSAFFRKTPRFVDWIFDRPALLKLASHFAVSTRAEELGAMTVSVLRGEEGRQRKELLKLLDFLEERGKPDVANLTNSLLSAIAPALKKRLGCAVVCMLQGEEAFVERLGQPFRDEAQALIRRNALAVDLFIAPHESYADEMSEFLGVKRERVRVVAPGIDLAPYRPEGPRAREPFRVGYLSRLSPLKGLDLLVEAFRLLEGEKPGGAALAVAGETVRPHGSYWKKLYKSLEREGLAARVDYAGEVDFAGKARFLKSLSVFCLPSRAVEHKAVAAIEALGAGVPIIVPDRGIFPEMIRSTGGGLLVAPEDPAALARAIARLRDDPAEANRLGAAAASGAAEHFSAKSMAERMVEIYREIARD